MKLAFRIAAMVDKHNPAFREKTDAIHRMLYVLEVRMELVNEGTRLVIELT